MSLGRLTKNYFGWPVHSKFPGYGSALSFTRQLPISFHVPPVPPQLHHISLLDLCAQ